jgi:hypothetical protein
MGKTKSDSSTESEFEIVKIQDGKLTQITILIKLELYSLYIQ